MNFQKLEWPQKKAKGLLLKSWPIQKIKYSIAVQPVRALKIKNIWWSAFSLW
jgi:hypothetical protein